MPSPASGKNKTSTAKTPKAPKAPKAQRKKAAPKTSEASAAGPVRIPTLKLDLNEPIAATPEIPLLKLTTRREWTGAPPPWESVEGALAWGMSAAGVNHLVKKKYKNARRDIRELQNRVKMAANRRGPDLEYVNEKNEELKKMGIERPRGPGTGKGRA